MRIHHLAFRTTDLPRLEAFYVDVLGLAVCARKGDLSVWLELGGAILMLERAEPEEPGVVHGTMEMVAFDIEQDARVGYLRRLAEHGVPIEAQTDFTLYFRDPDGRRVGVSHYQ